MGRYAEPGACEEIAGAEGRLLRACLDDVLQRGDVEVFVECLDALTDQFG